ncbi:2-hydroxyacid dehydrogenase [Galbibacter sp. BG1]|uniref:2-hydroxyacid dehydrogenase n=1 Tax=Galbibacter sp. BG1 TaxID=1170699 RepID=UPI0015BB1CCB|nr:2-hydroxyacid dehydrogenase [Galbibacter sp. BG1]QLE02934.1 2-hydroxyacid dehydrogenase [Galbibacter sp. BG1]
MKIAVFSTKKYDKEFFENYNKDGNVNLTYFEVALKEQTANLTQGFDGICTFVNDKLDKKTLETIHSNGIKLILLRCAGFNNVDLKVAEDLGLKIYRVPAYSPHAVAEHALALILTLNRKTHKAYNRVREGNFSLERLRGFDLYKKTVGVIGTGKIGSAFCSIMLGMGCKILAHDAYENEDLKEKGVVYVSKNELLEQSDIVSLHCPLTDDTFHLMNEESIQKLKKGAMVINTSRGALINTLDILEALKDGRVGYLGIDVYEQEEKLFFNDLSESIIKDDTIMRLISFPNVLITSHQGFFTNEALKQITNVTLSNIQTYLNGTSTENEVSYSLMHKA